jgi:hypothetical protein
MPASKLAASRLQAIGLEMNEKDTTPEQRLDEIRLMQLVAMFQMAAMQQMGKLANPVTNEIERDLDQARASIDMIETLKRKTEGNRSAGETEFLDKVLFELHMNFVDESGRAAAEPTQNEASSETADPEK